MKDTKTFLNDQHVLTETWKYIGEQGKCDFQTSKEAAMRVHNAYWEEVLRQPHLFVGQTREKRSELYKSLVDKEAREHHSGC